MRGQRAWAGLAVALLAAGCARAEVPGAGPGTATARPAAGASLVSYRSCDELGASLSALAATSSGAGALGERGAPTSAAPMAAGPSGATGAVASAAPAAGNWSTTNDQQAGVDEPDLAKTDGRLLVALRQGPPTLEVADVGSVPGTPTLVGSLDLTGVVAPSGLFLIGSDAVLVGTSLVGASVQPQPMPAMGAGVAPGPMIAEPVTAKTEVVVVGLSDPAHPAVDHTVTVDGQLVAARELDGRMELVVEARPWLGGEVPGAGEARSGASAWLATVTSGPGGTTRTEPCTSVLHPVDLGRAQATGSSTAGSATAQPPTIGSPAVEPPAVAPSTVTVLSVDPASGAAGPERSVVGDANAVYVSTDALYVAMEEPDSSGTGYDTTVHAFDLSDPADPRYVGSGTVSGTLIGQYAMSEYQGALRIATTVGSATPPPSEGASPEVLSDSRVTVLELRDGALVAQGEVSGLGAGEKIYAVRFLGALGYVVTFRQTDPLYVLDLHDPTSPRLAGQLELTGYSSFLQPVGDTMLLGVGQGVDQNLRTAGLQVSLFDVSDPSAPRLVGRDDLAGAWSTAQNDAHALLYWAPSGLVVLPVTRGPGAASQPGFDGAIALSVTGGSLRELGRVSQPLPAASTPAPEPLGARGATPAMAVAPAGGVGIERAIVVGTMLYTVSEEGIMASDLASLQTVAYLPYGGSVGR